MHTQLPHQTLHPADIRFIRTAVLAVGLIVVIGAALFDISQDLKDTSAHCIDGQLYQNKNGTAIPVKDGRGKPAQCTGA